MEQPVEQQEASCQGWESLPPELLRRVALQLRSDWHYTEARRSASSLLPVRATCKAWRTVVDSDVKQVAVTVPPLAPEYLAEHFPGITRLDLARYQHSCQEIFPVLQQLQLRSLVLADPWDPPCCIPTKYLTQLTYLSYLAEGLPLPCIAAQFCQALKQLRQLQGLQLNRLQLSPQVAQQLAQVLSEMPHLRALALSGGAAPVSAAELYVLLNAELPGLRSLQLTRLGIRMLPLSLTKLVGLTHLTFGGEMLRNVQLRDELRQLTNLQVLDISANLAEQLPGGVLQMTSLRELHAGMNRLGVHIHSLRKLEQLQVLVLASNKLLAVHPSLWDLTTLKRLDLGHNNLSELPADIGQLTRLTFLNVCHNFLTVLPAALSCLVELVELDISLNADMRELPAGLGQLSRLERLAASHMRLKQLPSDIGGLVSLVHLDVSHNSLHHLSPQLSCLGSLTQLEASDNKLHQSAAVPEELATLTAIQVLRLARNRLQSLPEALGCYGSLQVLDCSGNRLTSVPRVVGKCTALQQLLMASNRLRGLTSGIGNLLRLQTLELSRNQYRHLPTMTGDLTQLQELLLEDNQLEDLPSSCSALIKLTSLTLSNNRLHVLPPAIGRMSALVHLTLRANPLLDRDAVVLQLQRQLPLLRLDELAPLGITKPTRWPGEGALQLVSNWPAEDAAGGDAPQTHNRAAHGALGSGAAPAWLLQQDLSRSLAQIIQQAVHQSQEPPAAHQHQHQGLIRLVLGNGPSYTAGIPCGSGPVSRVAAADNSSAEASAASAGGADQAGWLGHQSAAVSGHSADLHQSEAVEQSSCCFSTRQAMQAGSSSSAAALEQPPVLVQVEAQALELPDCTGQQQIAMAAKCNSSNRGTGRQDVLDRSATRVAVGDVDSADSMCYCCCGACCGEYAPVHAESAVGSAHRPSGGQGLTASAAAGATDNFVARVKSYLEVATSAATSAAGIGSRQAAVSRPQHETFAEAGLLRSASHVQHQGGCLLHCSTNQQVAHRVDGLQQSGSAAFLQSAAAAALQLQHCSGSPAASRPAAAAANQQAASRSTTGGASVSDRDADDTCSAMGVDSCGSEDSGSDVLGSLGAIGHGGMDASNSSAVCDQELLPTFQTCSPQNMPEINGQMSAAEMSRCPSSTSGVTGLGRGAVGLVSAGCSAASAAVDAVPAKDSCYRITSKVRVGALGKHASDRQKCEAIASGALSAVAATGSSQQGRQGDAERSFTQVLDTAWWGRRRN